jgi:hypothetical protein
MHEFISALFIFGVLGAAGGIGWLRWKSQQGKPPRQPMDGSPFLAGVISGNNERSYYPRGMTAPTPSGVTVTVRCPHRAGHRSPDLAVACGRREKARIETTGR